MPSRALIALSLFSCQVNAAMPEATVEIRNHLFAPQEVIIPANKKVRLVFVNYDATPEEIDSFDLNREKVIFGHSKGVIYVGPLPPGTYRFFGEYHPNTAVGTVRVITPEALPDAD
ncbi:cupredoxin domain-containing protein [Alteromonas sp. H39]|uniref:cupredoxin domain-containing protein n=1 Tax=Alteromonas sp. H39 TaxID=3389876 RepID=UPI0039E04530